MTPFDRAPGRDEFARARPTTEDRYGIPEREEGALPWSFVEDRLSSADAYWVTTVRPDGTPHARPTWGVWVDGRFHCGGGERTRWVRNPARDPTIVVHTESADEVVILEGRARQVDEETAEAAALERLDAAYLEKYDVEHGTPFFAVEPEVVLAWRDFPTDATKWVLEDGSSAE